MILMSMCDHKAFYFGNIFFQISNIRDDQIDTKHIIFRESKTTVNNYNTVFILKSSNVHSNLFQST